MGWMDKQAGNWNLCIVGHSQCKTHLNTAKTTEFGTVGAYSGIAEPLHADVAA